VILGFWLTLNTIARKPEHDKATGVTPGLNSALEPCPRDRHCVGVTINLQRPERSR
jgi:hypothetical protein